MQEFLNFCLEYSKFFTCASSSFGAPSNSHRQCWPGELSILTQGAVVFCGSAVRMFLKEAQYSQQPPPRVQVHHLKNTSQLIWHRAWEPKFVSDPGSPAGSIASCCPATRMDKVIFHSLCYSKIEQELYLKQESNTLCFRKLTGQKKKALLLYKPPGEELELEQCKLISQGDWPEITDSGEQMLLLLVLWLNLMLHPYQAAWLPLDH